MDRQKILVRDFLLCFFAQFSLTFAHYNLVPTLPIYLSRLGTREEEIGILIGILGVSSLVLRPFVGRALLRISEKNFMIAGALLFALSSVAYFLAPPFWPFLIVRIFQGIGLAFFYTASVTLIGNISPNAHRGQSLGYFYLAFNIAFAMGPSLGMFVINHFSFTHLFLVCFGLSLCSLFITNKLGRRQVDPLGDYSIEDRSFLSRKALPPSIVILFIYIIYGALTTFFPLYALDHGMTNPGLFFAAFAIMLILGRALGGKIVDRYNRERIILPCLIIYIIAMGILPFSKTPPMFLLVGVIWGIGNAFLVPALVAYTLDLAGSSRGPAMGTFTAASDLGVGLGPVIMGFILRLTSYPTMFLCLAFTCVINLLYFYFFVKRKNEGLTY